MGRVGRSRMIRSSRTSLAAKGAEASLGYIRPFGGGEREKTGGKEKRKETNAAGGKGKKPQIPWIWTSAQPVVKRSVRRDRREKQEGSGSRNRWLPFEEVMCGVWRLHLKYRSGVCGSPSLYSLLSAFSKVGCGRKVSELLRPSCLSPPFLNLQFGLVK